MQLSCPVSVVSYFLIHLVQNDNVPVVALVGHNDISEMLKRRNRIEEMRFDCGTGETPLQLSGEHLQNHGLIVRQCKMQVLSTTYA